MDLFLGGNGELLFFYWGVFWGLSESGNEDSVGGFIKERGRGVCFVTRFE